MRRGSYGEDVVSTLAHSKPVRVWLERDGEPILYEITSSGPCRDIIREHIDIRGQMEADELSPLRVQAWLDQFLRREPLVERVAVAYAGGRYCVTVLASLLTKPLIVSLQAGVAGIRSLFGNLGPLVYILGPDDRDAELLNGTDLCAARPA